METTTLSKAETRVLQELLEGYDTTEIAERLYLSPYTIKNHIRNIEAKLGCHSMGGIIATVYRLTTKVTMAEILKKVGTLCLLAIFSAYTFAGDGDDVLRARRSRRNRRDNEIEITE